MVAGAGNGKKIILKFAMHGGWTKFVEGDAGFFYFLDAGGHPRYYITRLDGAGTFRFTKLWKNACKSMPGYQDGFYPADLVGKVVGVQGGSAVWHID